MLRETTSVVALATAAMCLIFGSGAGCQGSASGSTPSSTVADGNGSSGQNPDAIVAKAKGIEITRAQLDEATAVARYNEVDQRLYQLEQRTAMQLVIEGLIKQKAGDMDIEEFLEAEAKKEPVTDAEIQQIYDVNKARMGNRELDDTMRQQISDYIIGQRQQDYVSKLMDEAGVEVLLEPPSPPKVQVSVDDDPSKGPKNAKVTVIEFSDFQCPACRQAAQIVPGVLKDFGDDVRLVYRDFPLQRKHPQAFLAAIAAECAEDQGKFWEYHDTLFANSRAQMRPDLERYAQDLELNMDKFKACLDDPKSAEEVRKDIADGNQIGVNATPTFIVNGSLVSGADPATLRRLIRKELGLPPEES